MGLFDSDKETYVNSAVYNMAGEEGSRPEPLKAAIVRRAIGKTNQSTSEMLISTIMNGPGVNQRKFFKWATDNYTLGMPTGNILSDKTVDTAAVTDALVDTIAAATVDNLEVITGIIDKADATYWAEEYIANNLPGKLEHPWSVSIDHNNRPTYSTTYGYASTVQSKLVISFAPQFFGDLEQVLIDVPADLIWAQENADRRLLYVTYNLITIDPTTSVASVEGPYLFTYRMGSGVAALDALAPVSATMSEFYPAIPLRLNNKYVSEYPDHESDLYKAAEKAYKKLTDADIQDLLLQIDDNPDISEIDYAMIVQGVPINTSEQMGRRYLFEFFKTLRDVTPQTPANYDQTDPEIVDGIINTTLRNRWKNVNTTSNPNNPNFGTSRPTSAYVPQNPYPLADLVVRMPDLSAFHYYLNWESIKETTHAGNIKRYDGNQTRELAKKGEYWITQGKPWKTKRIRNKTISGSEGETKEVWVTVDVPRTLLFHQHSKYMYTMIEVRDLNHGNYVYKSFAVKTSADEAMNKDSDSRFIVPLHFPTIKTIGKANANKLANSSSYLVFNTVEVVKIKWYEKGFFKVVFVFAAVATAAFTGGLSLAGGAGVLGTNTAVGLSLGASAATAAIVGAAVNYIAATIVTAIIQAAAQEFIGGAAGAIIGTIASFVAMQYGAQFVAEGNFNVDWGSLMQVDNLIKLTDSMAGAYTKWMEGETQGIAQEIADVSEEYNEQMEEIKEMSESILGMTNLNIDPMMYTDATEYFEESRDGFLNRTLLTGSDIANLTHGFIEHFAAISLELPRARTSPTAR